jgi:hypothetical protein
MFLLYKSLEFPCNLNFFHALKFILLKKWDIEFEMWLIASIIQEFCENFGMIFQHFKVKFCFSYVWE